MKAETAARFKGYVPSGVLRDEFSRNSLAAIGRALLRVAQFSRCRL